jgi:hypothetical protein
LRAQLLFTAGVLAAHGGDLDILRHLVQEFGLNPLKLSEDCKICVFCDVLGPHKALRPHEAARRLHHHDVPPSCLRIVDAAAIGGQLHVLRYLRSLGDGFRLTEKVRS